MYCIYIWHLKLIAGPLPGAEWAGQGRSQKQTAASVRFYEGAHLPLPFYRLEEEAEGPGWTAPRETSHLPASPFVNGF